MTIHGASAQQTRDDEAIGLMLDQLHRLLANIITILGHCLMSAGEWVKLFSNTATFFFLMGFQYPQKYIFTFLLQIVWIFFSHFCLCSAMFV